MESLWYAALCLGIIGGVSLAADRLVEPVATTGEAILNIVFALLAIWLAIACFRTLFGI